MSKNFVNVGQLYHSPPVRGKLPTNSVNLGNLYAMPQSERPRGFAYFEDGSILLWPAFWPGHTVFEAKMKLFQPFVRGPSPNLAQIRHTDAKRRRLIVIV